MGAPDPQKEAKSFVVRGVEASRHDSSKRFEQRSLIAPAFDGGYVDSEVLSPASGESKYDVPKGVDGTHRD